MMDICLLRHKLYSPGDRPAMLLAWAGWGWAGLGGAGLG